MSTAIQIARLRRLAEQRDHSLRAIQARKTRRRLDPGAGQPHAMPALKTIVSPWFVDEHGFLTRTVSAEIEQ